MGERVALLDHGYLECIETWGSEERIIEAARMSTAKGFLGWGERHEESCPATQPAWVDPTATRVAVSPFGGECNCTPKPGDEKLLRYLWENKHATPFEMAGATFEVMAPIMVFREWHRHRVPFGYNELSARYTPLPDVNYVPTIDRLLVGGDGKNKQAGTIAGAGVLDEEGARDWLIELENVYAHAERVYQAGLRAGVPKELARLPVPVGRYSRMRATGNLRGWLSFLVLRQAKGAQLEIRVFADAVHDALARTFPRTLALFDERKPG